MQQPDETRIAQRPHGPSTDRELPVPRTGASQATPEPRPNTDRLEARPRPPWLLPAVVGSALLLVLIIYFAAFRDGGPGPETPLPPPVVKREPLPLPSPRPLSPVETVTVEPPAPRPNPPVEVARVDPPKPTPPKPQPPRPPRPVPSGHNKAEVVKRIDAMTAEAQKSTSERTRRIVALQLSNVKNDLDRGDISPEEAWKRLDRDVAPQLK
jgi:hypothetical protein